MEWGHCLELAWPGGEGLEGLTARDPRSQASTPSFCRLQYEKRGVLQATKAGCGGLGKRLTQRGSNRLDCMWPAVH